MTQPTEEVWAIVAISPSRKTIGVLAHNVKEKDVTEYIKEMKAFDKRKLIFRIEQDKTHRCKIERCKRCRDKAWDYMEWMLSGRKDGEENQTG